MERRGKVEKIDRPVGRGRPDISLSAFSYLFAEVVQYSQGRVNHVYELETRLADIGASVGARLMETMCFRERSGKRELRIVPVLSFIAGTIWKQLFGKQADLERSTEHEDECTFVFCYCDFFWCLDWNLQACWVVLDMLSEKDPLVNRFISVPASFGHLNCAAFSAGIVRGALEAAEFVRFDSVHVPMPA
jgi:hypothetical protein